MRSHELVEDPCDLLRRMPVPEGLRLRPRGIEVLDCVEDVLRLRAHEGIPAVLDRLDPLRLIAERDAGDAEEVRLLLHAAGVRDDLRGVHEEGDEVEVVDGGDPAAPSAARLCRVRGWTGNTSGGPAWASASTTSFSTSGSSTFCGRCIVTRTYSPGLRPSLARTSLERAACALWSATSYMTSPTRCTPRVIPSRVRLSTAVCVGQKRTRDRWSATTRLISSGIARLYDRRPASTRPSGTRIFDATSAPASVAFG